VRATGWGWGRTAPGRPDRGPHWRPTIPAWRACRGGVRPLRLRARGRSVNHRVPNLGRGGHSKPASRGMRASCKSRPGDPRCGRWPAAVDHGTCPQLAIPDHEGLAVRRRPYSEYLRWGARGVASPREPRDEAGMRLTPLAVHQCGSNSCPAVYAAEGQDDLVVQGWVAGPAMSAGVPAGEQRVVLPREVLLAAVRELIPNR